MQSSPTAMMLVWMMWRIKYIREIYLEEINMNFGELYSVDCQRNGGGGGTYCDSCF